MPAYFVERMGDRWGLVGNLLLLFIQSVQKATILNRHKTFNSVLAQWEKVGKKNTGYRTGRYLFIS